MVVEISEGAPPETVLVAEDDVLVRMVISDYLRSCGYRVVEARSTDAALEILRDAATRVDVVLCGIAMGGAIDAFGLAAWLAANRTDVDIVLAGSAAGGAQPLARQLSPRGLQIAEPEQPSPATHDRGVGLGGTDRTPQGHRHAVEHGDAELALQPVGQAGAP